MIDRTTGDGLTPRMRELRDGAPETGPSRKREARLQRLEQQATDAADFLASIMRYGRAARIAAVEHDIRPDVVRACETALGDVRREARARRDDLTRELRELQTRRSEDDMRRVAAIVLATLILAAPAHAVDRGDRGPAVTRVQEHLRWFGYSIATDGVFGAQTERAVRHWQRAQGLEPDGVVGPLTEASLGIRGEAVQVTPPPAPPMPTFANDCDEMSWYRQAAGLPAVFDAIGKRESSCDNTVGNYCCHGWWANYLSSHLSSQSAYRERIIHECGVTAVSDIRGPTAEQKMRQACVTKVVYDRSGLTPWAT